MPIKHPLVQVDNLTTGTTIASTCRVADNFFSRLKGLMGVPELAAGEGLLIVPCNSIHTHFMRFPIDVVYVSREGTVVAFDHAMVPWRFGKPRRGARFVVELPAGVLASTGTQPGDQLIVNGYQI